MDTCTDVATGQLTDLARERARAEARETEAMLRFRDAEMVRTEDVRPVLRRQIERAAITLEIGQAMGLTEGQVHHRLSSAARVREHTPQTWLAFRAGHINEPRVREISLAINTLQRTDSLIRLDQRVVAYAQSHTVPELRRWLRRFIQRVEATSPPHAPNGPEPTGGSRSSTATMAWRCCGRCCRHLLLRRSPAASPTRPRPSVPPIPAPHPNAWLTCWPRGAPPTRPGRRPCTPRSRSSSPPPCSPAPPTDSPKPPTAAGQHPPPGC